MSKEDLTEFLNRIAEDGRLKAELHSERLTAQKVVALAARHGFQLASQELHEHVTPLTDEAWANAANSFDKDHPQSYILFLEEVPMSKEALNAFFKKVAEDEALQKKLVEFAAAQGFEFSADELNDSDLDSVAGGIISFGGDISLSSQVVPKLEDLTGIKVEDLTAIKVEDLTDIKLEDFTP